MKTMEDIQKLARKYADTRVALGLAVKGYDKEVALVRRTMAPAIVKRAGRAGQAQSDLVAAIEASPHLFEQPKTVVLDGITCGYRKQPGKVEVSNPAETIRLIRRHFAERTADLIKTSETVVKNAVRRLSAAEVQKLGVSVVDSTDEVVAEAKKTDMEKTVEAFLKEAGQ